MLHEDLKARMRVLRRLGYIDAGAAARSWGCGAHSSLAHTNTLALLCGSARPLLTPPGAAVLIGLALLVLPVCACRGPGDDQGPRCC